MKERPILFSGAMVRALLAGTKTQTRRVMKPQPALEADGLLWWYHRKHSGSASHVAPGRPSDSWLEHCPYGQPGDRLWVRETWQAVRGNDRARHICTHPKPDVGWIEYAATPRIDEPAYKWRPSIHMFRWASRITLEITAVRVERLQDISAADALAEGIVELEGGGFGLTDGAHFHLSDPCISYWSLWDAINGAGSVQANPWVWAVSFRVAPQEEKKG